MKPVAVLIPTLRRPDSLARAVRSVLAQDEAGTLVDEIVIVDNSPEGSARPVVGAAAATTLHRVRYVHEPHPGVATARNRGLQGIAAPYVAFLDDDEEASRSWLSGLHAAHVRLGAAVTFGPVRGVATGAPAWAQAYLERFFSRTGPSETGLIRRPYGCGGSIMTRAVALTGPAPFDVAGDEVGGEDDRLFAALQARGARFGWAADAWVFEHPPAYRVTVGYALKRAFGHGQSPVQIAWRRRHLAAVLGWMAVGAGQAIVFGPSAAALWAMRRPERAPMADRAAQGLGKIGWFLRLRFYGAAEVRRSARTEAGRTSRVEMATNSTHSTSL